MKISEAISGSGQPSPEWEFVFSTPVKPMVPASVRELFFKNGSTPDFALRRPKQVQLLATSNHEIIFFGMECLISPTQTAQKGMK